MNHKITFTLALSFALSAHAETLPVTTEDVIVVTATRFPAKQKNEAASISVLTRADIESNPSASLPELLATLPGVQISNNSGTPEFAIGLRGFGASGNQNTLVLLDGQRLNENELTPIKWTAIPLETIDRIEVIRGAGAVMFGGGASGGVINIITRKPIKMGGLKTMSVAAGSYGLKEATAYLSGVGEVAWSLSGNALNTDNYRQNNALQQRNIEAALQGSDWTIRAGGDDQNLRLPGARNQLQLTTDRRGTATPRDFSTRQGTYVSGGWTRAWGAYHASLDMGYRQNHRTALFDDYNLDGYDAKSYLDTKSHVTSLQPRMEMQNELLGRAGSVVAGLDGDDWNYDSHRFTGSETLPGVTSATVPSAHITASQRNLAAYARQTLELGQTTHLTLGGRVQYTHSEARDQSSTQPYASGARSDSPWAAEVGLKQGLSANWSAFGRLGHSFRVATVDEMYDAFGGPAFDPLVRPLRPQTSNDVEAGLEYNADRMMNRISAYAMHLRDEIHFNALTFTNENLMSTRRYGLEAESEYQFSSGLKVRAGYTYTVAQFREGVYGGIDVAGNDIPLVPRHSASFALTWQLIQNQRISLAGRYVGEQRFDNDQANTFVKKMSAYTVVDLKWQSAWNNWKIYAEANNLLNEKYFSYAVGSTFTPGVFNAYPMPERNVRLGLEYAFK